MGNALRGSKKAAKVMKISGDTFKCKTPVVAGEVVRDYPGHVLLEATEVKQFGIRARPLDLHHELKPKKLYFLVELPKCDGDEKEKVPKVGSGIRVSAKDRLESLKLSRRAMSDMSGMKSNPRSIMFKETASTVNSGRLGESSRLKFMLPRAEVARLMEQSGDKAEAAQRILDLCLSKYNNNDCFANDQSQQMHWYNEKRLRFLPNNDGEIQQEIPENWCG
uniref:Uncharacterized protein n=1 Tax=Kalanchoe fedtschenkoi TaxID=63787 RepID=A0A7N0VGL8_KALFE